MTRQNLERYRKLLETKKAELEGNLRTRDGITVEQTADELDGLLEKAQRQMAIETLDRESKLLARVRAAMQRIEQGIFGVCLGCEEDIPPKRLEAVPWTHFCIQCQANNDLNPMPEEELAIEDGEEQAIRESEPSRILTAPEQELSPRTPQPHIARPDILPVERECPFDKYCQRYRVSQRRPH